MNILLEVTFYDSYDSNRSPLCDSMWLHFRVTFTTTHRYLMVIQHKLHLYDDWLSLFYDTVTWWSYIYMMNLVVTLSLLCETGYGALWLDSNGGFWRVISQRFWNGTIFWDVYRVSVFYDKFLSEVTVLTW